MEATDTTEGNSLVGPRGHYGAVELGHHEHLHDEADDTASINIFRHEQPRNVRTARSKVGMVVAVVIAVVLAALAVSAPSRTAKMPPPLKTPGPEASAEDPFLAATPGNDVAGPGPKDPVGWQDMVPKNVLNKTHGHTESASHPPAEANHTQAHDHHGHNSTSSTHSKGNSTSSQPMPAKKGDGARNCSQEECADYSSCDPASFPFVCVEGFAKGGCAKTQKAWENPGCGDFCTLAHCVDHAPGCGDCSESDCHRLQVVCGVQRHYACVEGASAGGCSDEADYWPQGIFNGICKKCCDLKTCGMH
ncbi:hypothetical protein NSK_006868 [Nannochloropsis salina CCMP1776]|jgi:hypothetical protein|uniref:Uncharacterized protein n=1 Tax=Nannochloropsis salina CCMP1776 TaxID=1027361 RepID=A0A4D9CU72_9STRA|nr:hypothetical protein NSK_006868 [Nannochloropsis salina CCMP1776]|eukprot:TFJ81617.1 hypothetical protein NSK_006868 [Nannochloropsis salina CCMP1776]